LGLVGRLKITVSVSILSQYILYISCNKRDYYSRQVGSHEILSLFCADSAAGPGNEWSFDFSHHLCGSLNCFLFTLHSSFGICRKL